MNSKGITKRLNASILSKRKNLAIIGVALGLFASLFLPAEKPQLFQEASFLSSEEVEDEQLGSFPIIVPTIKYGFALDTFQVLEDRVLRNQTLGTLLSDFGVENWRIEQLRMNCKGVFEIQRDFKAGNSFTLLTRHEGQAPDYLVLEPNVFEYVVFNLKNGQVTVTKREMVTKTHFITGSIESSLWAALNELKVSTETSAKMEDALECFVDFSRTTDGDEFKLLFDENYIAGKAVSAGQVYAAEYTRDGKDYYAFWFDNGEQKGFFDMDGSPARRGFLKSPVKYSRISSNYNLRRFHPILKHVRPHLGTDYAAPYGTPIYAVSEGTVVEAAQGKGNGRYVKIKHDNVYQTQYLHMSRFAKGIRRGSKVAQGQVIGYVGSSGLATGPHVCFRFWKNGRQVNHLRLNLP
ncbi:MAG: peptidoglycan DD-metalloendopeptidase family protein, partial [Bacteroidota bacterium]